MAHLSAEIVRLRGVPINRGAGECRASRRCVGSAGEIAAVLRIPAAPRIGIDGRRVIGWRRSVIPVRIIGARAERGAERQGTQPEADRSPGANSATAVVMMTGVLCIGGA